LFRDDIGIESNLPLKEVDEALTKMDGLALVIVYDSEMPQSQGVFAQVFLPVIHQTRDYVRVFAFDCRAVASHDLERLQQCARPKELPYIQLYKPPASRVDPLTLDPVPIQSIYFNETELKPTTFYSFIVNNIPDYMERISTFEDLETFV